MSYIYQIRVDYTLNHDYTMCCLFLMPRMIVCASLTPDYM